MEKTYLYMVHPRKVITGLSGATALRSPKSLLLTKEDVKICLQRASVYRRFAMEGINVRVTIDAVDRLHNDHFIPEDKWDAEKGVEIGATAVETPAPEVKEEVKVEEPVKEEAPVVEEKVEEVVEEVETNQTEEVTDDKQEELESSVEEQESVVAEESDGTVVEEAAAETEETNITDDEVVAEESAEDEENEESEAPVDESTDGETSETEEVAKNNNVQQFNYHKKKKH